MQFVIMSKPVLLDDGKFGVLFGTVDGISLKRFPTLLEAQDYYDITDGSLRMGVGMPFRYFVVESGGDYASCRALFDQKYAQVSSDSSAFSKYFARWISAIKGALTHAIDRRR